MKLAAILLVCFVGVSWQQQQQQQQQLLQPAQFWPYAAPRIRLLPFIYPRYHAFYESQLDDAIPAELDVEEPADVQGRIRPQKKFFSGFNLAAFGNGLGGGVGGVGGGGNSFIPTYTSTLMITSTTTVVTATINTCLPEIHFTNAAAKSATCNRRRRRDVLTIGDDDGDVGQLPRFQADYQEELTLPQFEALLAKKEEAEPHPLVSSMDDVDEPAPLQRRQRAFNAVVFTSTSTVTSFVFSSTTIKKTLRIIRDPIQGVAGMLTCLPPGFDVC